MNNLIDLFARLSQSEPVERIHKMPSWRLASEDKTLSIDLSHHPLNAAFIDLLKEQLDNSVEVTYGRLAGTQVSLAQKFTQLFSGAIVNDTSNSRELHQACRNKFVREGIARHFGLSLTPDTGDLGFSLTPDTGDMAIPSPPVQDLEKILADQISMLQFAKQIRTGKSATLPFASPIKDIVFVGVGGSSLGPLLIHETFKSEEQSINIHIFEDTDPNGLKHALASLDPRQTIGIVCSKSFGTFEVVRLAQHLQKWLDAGLDEVYQGHHLYAISADAKAMADFGVLPQCQLPMHREFSGRYSIWGAVGLVLAITHGEAAFVDFLNGGAAADSDLFNLKLSAQGPVICGALDWVYSHTLAPKSRMILVWQFALKRLVEYVGQLEMESVGKYGAGQIVWGGYGGTEQHSRLQALHQSMPDVPVDMVIDTQGDAIIINQAKAQVQALALGNIFGVQESVDHKSCPGGRPVSVWELNGINPHNLGLLLASWEHRVFTHAALAGVNPYDQWGVELGKSLFKNLVKN